MLAATFLYIFLELYVRSVSDTRALGLGDLKIVANAEVADDTVQDVGWEGFNLCV